MHESLWASLWRWLSSSHIPLDRISSPWGFSPYLMPVSPLQCHFCCVHPTGSPCLPSPLLQPRAEGCVCRGAHGVQAMSHTQFRFLLFPHCLGWKGKSIWALMAGDMASLWVTLACQDLPGPSILFRLSSVCSSLCSVNQKVRYFWCCPSLGAIPLLVELTRCAWGLPVTSQLGEPPTEASRGCW